MADVDVKLRIIVEMINKTGAQLQRVVGDLSQVATRADAVQTPLRRMVDIFSTVSNQANKPLKRMVDIFGQVDKSVKKTGATVSNVMDRMAQNILKSQAPSRKLAATYKKLGPLFSKIGVLGTKNMNQIVAGTVKAKGSTAQLMIQFKKMGKASNSLKAKLIALNARFRKMGTLAHLVVAGAIYKLVGAFVQLGKYMFIAAVDFEKAMSRVEAVAQGTEEQMKALSDEAKRLGAVTKFTAVEAAEGLRFLAMAGLTVEESLAALEPTLDLAAAGSLEVSRAADIATNIMSAMSLEVTDLNHVMDVLANTAANSNTNIEQMAQALRYAAPIAKAAGIDIDNLGALIGRLGSNGIQASMAGTTLRGMIISLAAPTNNGAKALKRLGVEVAHTNDGSLDLTETLRRLNKAQLDVGEATKIFRRRAASAALAIVDEAAAIDELAESNRKADAEIKRMADTMIRNLAGSATIAKSAFTGFAIALVTEVLPILTLLVDGFAKVTNGVTILVEEVTGARTRITEELDKLPLPVEVLGKIFLFFLKATYKVNTAVLQVAKAIQGVREETRKYEVVMKALESSRETEIKSIEEITALTEKEADAYIRALRRKIKYYQTAEEYSKTAAGEIKGLSDKTEEYKNKWVEAEGTITSVQNTLQKENVELGATMETPIENLKEFEKTALKAYENAIKQVKKYKNEIIEAEQAIAFIRLETADKIKALEQDLMSDEESHNARRVQLEEKLDTVRDIMSKKREDISKQDIELVEKILSSAETLATGLSEKITKTTTDVLGITKKALEDVPEDYKTAVEKVEYLTGVTYESIKRVNDTVIEAIKEETVVAQKEGAQVAIDALTEISNTRIKVQKLLEEASQEGLDTAQAVADKYIGIVDKLAEDREVGMVPTLKEVRVFEEEINALIKRMSGKKIYVQMEILEPDKAKPTEEYPSNAKGGPIYKAARGMKLPGESKKDSILTLMRPGEWAVNNEAVHVWERAFGDNFMEAINAPWSSLGQKIKNTLSGNIPKFNFGGMVEKRFIPRMRLPSYQNGGQIGAVKNLGTVSFNIGNNAYPVLGEVNVINKLKEAIERENLVRTNN